MYLINVSWVVDEVENHSIDSFNNLKIVIKYFNLLCFILFNSWKQILTLFFKKKWETNIKMYKNIHQISLIPLKSERINIKICTAEIWPSQREVDNKPIDTSFKYFVRQRNLKATLYRILKIIYQEIMRIAPKYSHLEINCIEFKYMQIYFREKQNNVHRVFYWICYMKLNYFNVKQLGNGR